MLDKSKGIHIYNYGYLTKNWWCMNCASLLYFKHYNDATLRGEYTIRIIIVV